MSLTKESLELVRSLMGAPLCCLYALALAGGPLPVTELRSATGYSHSAIARALRRLRRMGFVEYERPQRSYSFSQNAFARALLGPQAEEITVDMLSTVLRQKEMVELQRRRLESLSPRERQILLLVFQRDDDGLPYTIGQIANELSLSFDTVRDHLRSIRAKLHVNSKAELLRLFRDWEDLV